ncbi:hypothetical protein JOM56_007128 [Amanita muscaria]
MIKFSLKYRQFGHRLSLFKRSQIVTWMNEQGSATLQQETSLASALALFETVISVQGNSRPPSEFTLFFEAAPTAQAARIFAQLETREDTKPTSMTLIQAYTKNAREIKAFHKIPLKPEFQVQKNQVEVLSLASALSADEQTRMAHPMLRQQNRLSLGPRSGHHQDPR